MIKLFLYCLLALGFGAVLAIVLATDPGYILVNIRGWTVEATLASVIVSVLVLCLLAYGLWWLVRLLNPLQLFRRGLWHNLFSGSPAAASADALQLLLLGRWQDAYKVLVENAERVDNPTFNYLAASLAAFKRGDRVSWSWCLDQAEKKAEGNVHGIKSLRALLDTRSGHAEQGLALLLALQRVAPGSPFVLAQIKDIFVSLARWDELAALLPELDKHKVVSAEELRALSEEVHTHRLEQAAAAGVESLRMAWHDLPKALRNNEKLLALYLEKLLRFGQDTEAGAILGKQLKHEWSDNLVGMLGFVNTRSPQEQLLLLENWLKQRPNNPVLLLTLGRLCLRNQLWGKGREYFELALRVTKSPELSAEINAELARLLEHLGERDKSLACYQKALGMMKYPLPDLPLPVKR